MTALLSVRQRNISKKGMAVPFFIEGGVKAWETPGYPKSVGS
jgi:hypothetical protein